MVTTLISNLICSRPAESEAELKSRGWCVEAKLGGLADLLLLWIAPAREEKAGSSLQEGTYLRSFLF